ncbi:hypothetical protein ASPZODRAFT_67220 [Penicilliopsis zonata CBS 506.65]|uniref:PAC domain-containing protein n=1 Tax=Penicilliopsis zonata CBS 506.65 TaxID=1073090 RepID=A0A1L9SFY1_9EURO|nr:hypothetical protein ASPZODRAFT_67220 [Penicilliopsis zonata CBS 506.65]OJJ46033.1 hypothetical protein ASPZODRAFT_67220 [Penicilliopsis zonata CBS 506.65]
MAHRGRRRPVIAGTPCNTNQLTSVSSGILEFPPPPGSLARGLSSNDLALAGAKSSIKALRRQLTMDDLPLLQEVNPFEGSQQFDPINTEEASSYDLVAPYAGNNAPLHRLEEQAEIMFSTEHMTTILSNPGYLYRFREFLAEQRPRSVMVLEHYLNARKALKAIQYANALARDLAGMPEIQTSDQSIPPTTNEMLEDRAAKALAALTAEELPAFITSTCITITSKVVEERIRGTLPAKFQATSDALAEVFCLTDPSRPDNPIIFASEEFHRTTQYGMDYVLGRNCRFLQGPKTNRNSTRRIREGIEAGRHHSELFLNYRRDGSPFMNLLQCAPLCDSTGKIRYFIGAQIDVSGLAMDGANMESLQTLAARKRRLKEPGTPEEPQDRKSEFIELSELMSPQELTTSRTHGGKLFKPASSLHSDRCSSRNTNSNVHWADECEDGEAPDPLPLKPSPAISLAGVYENYLLVRPYPSLRILFTSPSLRIPGILQSSFFSRIGGSASVRDDLLRAMIAGRSVTARVRWLNRYDDHGRGRWVHCTPLLANNGGVGVWMVILVDDEEQTVRWRGNWPS